MNKRHRERLNSLANFIEKNPEAFDQTDSRNCVVGLGIRLHRGKLTPSYDYTLHSADLRIFAARFGVTLVEAEDIFTGYWSRVNRKTKDARKKSEWLWMSDEKVIAQVPARRAALFLRQVAKNHA